MIQLRIFCLRSTDDPSGHRPTGAPAIDAMQWIVLFFLLFLLVFLPANSQAHPGKLDANGCHTEKRSGEYHCHEQPQSDSRNKKTESKTRGIRITGVSDGDTVKAIVDGKQVKIRLYCIDAPESKQAFGQAARKQLMGLTSGRGISMQVVDKDHYGRLVALLYNDGGTCLNEEMVKAGMAWIYPQYCKAPYREQWKKHENAARKKRKGLWRDKAPTPPWQWRKEQKEQNDDSFFSGHKAETDMILRLLKELMR